MSGSNSNGNILVSSEIYDLLREYSKKKGISVDELALKILSDALN